MPGGDSVEVLAEATAKRCSAAGCTFFSKALRRVNALALGDDGQHARNRFPLHLAARANTRMLSMHIAGICDTAGN